MAFDTVSETAYVPVVANVWLGFCAVLVPPSPKLHDHDVGVPVDASVNWTVWLTPGEPGE
jgi:hypothetical protein